ncbi:MAG: bis(5'-nucleosyl)-tetraphosphatase (symmetrical) YqeK [Chloroflexi bacterium]|nr:bis(5'-nucleosyl)-tetraphosphatase (symmetrical) YqeK [Chloroflexota bacterium]
MTAAIAAQIAAVRAELETRPEGLIRHVGRVLHEALDLAWRWDIDPERTELAVWGHDLFRSHSSEELLRLSRESGLVLRPEDEAAPVMLHGPLAAVVLRERFGVDDDEALAAVRDHTAGLAEMPMLAKIVLIADKVEERKRNRTPVMKEIRRLAQRDLDLALLCWADWKWVDERLDGYVAYPVHWEARRRWVGEHHADIGLPARMAGEAFEDMASADPAATA